MAKAVKEAMVSLQQEIVDLKEKLKKIEVATVETTVKPDNLGKTLPRSLNTICE